MNKSIKSITQICAVDFTYTRFIHPLSLHLASKGYSVSASFACSCSSDELFINQFAPVTIIPGTYFRSLRPSRLLASWLSLIQALRLSSHQLVHVHTPLISYLIRLQFYFPFIRKSRKLIYTVHGFYFHPNGNLVSNIIHFLLELLLLPSCDLVFFVSMDDYRFASRYLSLLRIPHSYIGNGVSTSIFTPTLDKTKDVLKSYSHSLPDKVSNPFVVGFVGRLVPEKGLLELFEAFAFFHQMYPDSYLLLVGDRLQSDHDRSISYAFDLILKKIPHSIITTGLIDDKETLADLYRSMDIFCLPSYREGLPTSLIEAMSCGIPSIATSVRGCTQLIKHESNGLLVPPKSSAELFSAMCRLRSQPRLMDSISYNARATIVSDYNITNILENQFSQISSL